MSLFETIQKDNIKAIKARDEQAKIAYGALISAAKNQIVDFRAKGKEFSDADMIKVIQKTLKELKEEFDSYAQNGREESAKEIQTQIDIVKKYEPVFMSEEEVKKIIEGLADKSMKNVMLTFKTNYAGKADMGMVSKIAKQYQGK